VESLAGGSMAPMDLPPPRITAESESLAEENESLISLWLFSENRVSSLEPRSRQL
jgi:hypothetical protein